MKRYSVFFTGPKTVEVRQEAVAEPQPYQVLVHTKYSAISPGTEMLIYRRQFSPLQDRDLNIRSLSGGFDFPVKYGYSTVGQVVSAGSRVDPAWVGRKVFSFHPHESMFNAFLDELIEIPGNIPMEDAVFLANMETAVNFIMDGRPGLGEKVIVFGQGIVGLLTTSLLSRFPLNSLVTLDRYNIRRQASRQMGAGISLDPGENETIIQIKSLFRDGSAAGSDLTFEISGNGEALNQAIELTGFDGRVVIGSWYGSNPVTLALDSAFHRSRIRLGKHGCSCSPGALE